MKNIILLVVCFTLLHLAGFLLPQNLSAALADAKYRPRVLYFYANWCPTCNRFGPVLKKSVSAYSNYVDFEQVNVDDPNSRSLTQRFHITSIPATYIFNSKGQAVFAKKGYTDQQSIYNVLRSVYLESATGTNGTNPTQKQASSKKTVSNKK